MRTINKIILHCSASDFGNAELIDLWHRRRGWKGIGYHYVICNAYSTAYSLKERCPRFPLDGKIEQGRPETELGAHTLGHNKDSIGICLIGNELFSHQQYVALIHLLKTFQNRYPNARLFGHYEFTEKKTCPNIDMDYLRKLL